MAKKEEAAAGTEVEHKTPDHKKREAKKSRWTPALCMKFAKRFDNEVEWAAGAPSSYKAAVARGYMKDCTKHMTAKAPAKAPAKKPAAVKAPAKKKKGA